MPCGMFAVESDEGDKLLLVGEFLLHLTDGLQCLVHSRKGLFADDGHRSTFIDNNQVEYSLVFFFFRLHSCNCLVVNHLFNFVEIAILLTSFISLKKISEKN